ncbi:MAG: hypothetical protein ACM3VS_18565 [Candidatus Dadabacteria bacterium]
MDSAKEPVHTLEQIKQMMDRGSRFVSLSGWSGIAAGICALAAAWVAEKNFKEYAISEGNYQGTSGYHGIVNVSQINRELFILAVVTFLLAFFFAFLFTWLRSRKTGVPLWGFMARKVLVNGAVPMIVGALFILRITGMGLYGLIAPACLLFYGLALINTSKFTLSEVRYLGYLQLFLGVVNLWFLDYGLYFWAAGFGVLHIIYGIAMWYRYERNEKAVA